MTDHVPMLRCQHLIVTIYGLYAREQGDLLPVSALVRMLGELGIQSAGVRSSVSRLKQRGVLESRRQGGRAQYAIARASLHIFLEGDSRIYAPTRASIDDPWLLVIFSVPERERAKRHTLRAELTRLGFGTVSSGVWVAPIKIREQSERQLSRLQLSAYVEFFRADYLGAEDLTANDGVQKVAQWWDLEGLDSLYAEFVGRYEKVLTSWATRLAQLASNDQGRHAFVDYVTMFTEWRRLPYLDPGLPLELLPEGWNGLAAEQIFNALHRLIGPLAHDYATSVIHGG